MLTKDSFPLTYFFMLLNIKKYKKKNYLYTIFFIKINETQEVTKPGKKKSCERA